MEWYIMHVDDTWGFFMLILFSGVWSEKIASWSPIWAEEQKIWVFVGGGSTWRSKSWNVEVNQRACLFWFHALKPYFDVIIYQQGTSSFKSLSFSLNLFHFGRNIIQPLWLNNFMHYLLYLQASLLFFFFLAYSIIVSYP